MGRTKREYVELASQGIYELLEAEHAVVGPEVEAKLSERRWETLPISIDPHHISTALQRLRGTIAESRSSTRGGRVIRVFHFAKKAGRARKIDDAAARKRLLHTRYRGWAEGTTAAGHVVGPALEAIVHASLREANGYTLARPEGGEVRHFLGEAVPGGPLDNAGFLVAIDPGSQQPHGPYAVPVEAKNVRSWIYPRSHLLHQLLDKAAMLQQRHSDRLFVPVLVCRQAHHITHLMAEDLGFYVIRTQRQYVRPSLGEGENLRALEEVREELAYNLEPHEGAVPQMVRHFSLTIPSVAQRTSERWRKWGSQLGVFYAQLRDPGMSNSARAEVVDDLATWATDLTGQKQRWHREDVRSQLDL